MPVAVVGRGLVEEPTDPSKVWLLAPNIGTPQRKNGLIARLHRTGTVEGMSNHPTLSENAQLRVPIAAAAERGVSWLNSQATERRVVLTKYGRPVSVVDSAERLDETARVVREARREVVEQMCEVAAGRAGKTHQLEAVCERLGIDVERVQQRSRELAG